jgi:hypothetical protein
LFVTDWHDLSTEQQNETKEFLLIRFSVDDLQLAWDQYYVQKGNDLFIFKERQRQTQIQKTNKN